MLHTNNCMVGGSFNIVKKLAEYLKKPYLNSTPPYFRTFSIPTIDGNFNRIALTNTQILNQVIIEIGEDNRFRDNDNRKYQCFTFIGEIHTYSTREVQLQLNTIKVWTLCKLLQIEFPSSVSFYLELESNFTHKKVYDEVDSIINIAYRNNDDALMRINDINNLEFKLLFLQMYNNRYYTLIGTKKVDKDIVIRLDSDIGSQSIYNTAYKLIKGNFVVDTNMVEGVSFVNNRPEALQSPFLNYSFNLYYKNYNELENVGLYALREFIRYLMNVFNDDTYELDAPNDLNEREYNLKFHIKSKMDYYKNDAKINNNKYFTNLFSFADVTRDFYLAVLTSIHNVVNQLYDEHGQNINIALLLNTRLGFDQTTSDKFEELWKTDLDTDPSSEFRNINMTKVLFTKLSNFILDSLESLNYLDLLIAITSRIMDYYTMAKFYENIFNSNNDAYSPDYHVIVCGSAHTIFVNHCIITAAINFDVLEPNNIKISNQQPNMIYKQSMEETADLHVCDITGMWYPKHDSE